MKLIIFDLDGVLINSLPNMKFALKNTANHINQKISFKNYKKYIGLPFEKILKKLNVKGDYNTIKSLSSGQNNNGIHEKGENVYSKKSKQL